MWSLVCRLSPLGRSLLSTSLKTCSIFVLVHGEKQQYSTCSSTLPHSWPKMVSGLSGRQRRIHKGGAEFSAATSDDHELSYGKIADETLENMLTVLEDFLDDLGLDDADVDYGQGVLTLKLGDKGTFVVNKQTPNKQIWLSSPISGPFRYDLIGMEWLYSRDGHKLQSKMSKELEDLCGRPINL